MTAVSGGVAESLNFQQVKGHCPMGCGETLFVASGGYLTCSYVTCPRPDAVATLLEDRETEHVVVFDNDGWTVRHPLRERLDDALLICRIHNDIDQLRGPPAQLGTYRAWKQDDKWVWSGPHV
jgi:hypothetical protein